MSKAALKPNIMKQSSTKLVFIVDDDPDDRQFILDALVENKQSIDYVFLDNAQDLLLKLNAPESETPDLIFLDLNMPGVMGLQALKEIRAKKTFNHIPIIVLTTSTLEMDRRLSYDYGANCFITKTHSFKKMIALADAIITLWLLDEQD